MSIVIRKNQNIYNCIGLDWTKIFSFLVTYSRQFHSYLICWVVYCIPVNWAFKNIRLSLSYIILYLHKCQNPWLIFLSIVTVWGDRVMVMSGEGVKTMFKLCPPSIQSYDSTHFIHHSSLTSTDDRVIFNWTRKDKIFTSTTCNEWTSLFYLVYLFLGLSWNFIFCCFEGNNSIKYFFKFQ